MSAKTSFWHLELSPCYMVDNFIQCFIRQVLQAQHCLLILLMFLYFFISLFQYPNTYGFWHSGDWWHFSSFPASFCHSLYWSVHFFLIKHTYYMHLPSSTFACKCRTSMVYFSSWCPMEVLALNVSFWLPPLRLYELCQTRCQKFAAFG